MDDRNQSLCFFAILGFAAVYLGFGFLYALDKRDTSNVPYEIFRGKVHAATAVDGPRLLLAGGSNVIWGSRSTIIENEGGVPTFNLALSSEAHDPKAMRILTTNAVRSGDTVIYSSISFWNSSQIDPAAAGDILNAAGHLPDDSSHFQSLKKKLGRFWSPYPQKRTVVTSLPALYRRYISHEPSEHMQGLNAKGDLASCLTPGAVPGPNSYVEPAEQSILLQELQDFEDALRQRGASLVLLFPPNLILEGERDKWIQNFTPVFEAMKRRFTVAQETLDASLYTDKSYFCDTGFHLADAEAAERSRRIGQFINETRKAAPMSRN
ncbi:MAG TPA: hypothetical protein VFO10_12345 [Oligoflexus sp.]|uniref:hypothetical protein n=1 Tax=Oligoflexus sp. TaxID=1971216 RepID=UPI002D80F221|nr:hypothetical protein [Oligoflexus sp.]HET9238039.1 hypothetical protein [Oligoflexus sp.]